MAQKSGIRWTKSRELELKKEVLNFNRRLKRARDKHQELRLPEPVDYKEVIPSLRSYQQYKNFLYDLRQATSKTLVASGESTRYQEELEKRQANRKTASPLAFTSKQLENAAEIQTSPKLGRLPSERDFIIKEIGIKKGQDPSEVLGKIREWSTGKNNKRAEGWRENYITSLERMLELVMMQGDPEAYSMIEELIEEIAQMDITSFILGQLSNPEQLAISNLMIYRSSKLGPISADERIGEIETLLAAWDRFI